MASAGIADLTLTLYTHDDRLLATQTAAPPPAPPRRPIVGAAMADDRDWPARLQELDHLLQLAQQTTRETLAQLRARLP